MAIQYYKVKLTEQQRPNTENIDDFDEDTYNLSISRALTQVAQNRCTLIDEVSYRHFEGNYLRVDHQKNVNKVYFCFDDTNNSLISFVTVYGGACNSFHSKLFSYAKPVRRPHHHQPDSPVHHQPVNLRSEPDHHAPATSSQPQ